MAIDLPRSSNPPPRVQLGPSFSNIDPRQAAFFKPRTRSAGLNLYDLANVTLHGGFMSLMADDSPISATNYLIDPVEWDNAPFFPPPEDRKNLPEDTRVVIGANRNFLTYYHWIAQAAPAIDHALRAPSDRSLSIALPDRSRQLQADTLRLLGLAHVELLSISDHETYHLPRARYVDCLHGRTAFEMSYAAHQTFRRLAAAVPDVPTGHDAIYVSRTDTNHRRMLNEPALMELLRTRGVSIVQTGRMTLAQQINLFRNARVVIGAHGSGMTNIAFCRPGALVYEIGLTSYPNACMNILAQTGDLTYQGDLIGPIEQPGDVHSATWEMDLDLMDRRLNDMPRTGRRYVAAAGGLQRTTPAEARGGDPAPPPVRLGIGVVTYNRADMLLRTLYAVRALTGQPYDLIVADDGSTDGTAARVQAAGVPLVTGRNMGVAWNKNRALFHLAVVKACDVIILLEDDTRPSEQGWEERWVAGALRWGHVNIAGEWFRNSFIAGAGTAEDPVLSKDISAQCSAYTRECLSFGGYMDPRFHGFGFEHVEHTWRLARLGFGGNLNITKGGAAPLFRLIAGGLEVQHGQSAGSADDVDRNRELCHRIMWEQHFRAPWTDDAQMRQFREEQTAAQPSPMKPQSGRP